MEEKPTHVLEDVKKNINTRLNRIDGQMFSNKKDILQIVLGVILLVIAIMIKDTSLSLYIYIIAYAIVGIGVIIRALKNIFKGKIFDENFLMGIATIGAFFIEKYPEAVTVMLLFKIGELFEKYAEDKTRKSISNLMDIKPDYANISKNGTLEKVKPKEVKIGDIIIIKPGEKVPLDGIIINGKSSIDTKALTGEAIPREVKENDEIISGCINLSGMLTVEVKKEFGESTVSKILDLVENANSKKANTENFITKFAKYYTPIVVLIALVIAIIPSAMTQDIETWIYRALTFLVVSCPCALVISVPLSFFGGIGGASKIGVLIKGSNYLEALANTEIIALDKTGTLTKGIFKVQEINSKGDVTKEEILEKAAYAENYSNHPISISIKTAYAKEIDTSRIKEVEEISGYGVTAVIDNQKVYVGSSKLMEKMKIAYEKEEKTGTVIHVAIDNTYVGDIIISDEIKEDTKKDIELLKNLPKVKKIIMLTGDIKNVADEIGKNINIDKVYSELLPNEKVEKIEELIKQKSNKGKVVFVGDGINDAPVLARSDIGIAMGGLRFRCCNRSGRCSNNDRRNIQDRKSNKNI